MTKCPRVNPTTRMILGAFVLASACFSLALPARAQIVPIRDEQGKIVYVNTGPRPSRSGIANISSHGNSASDSSGASSGTSSGASLISSAGTIAGNSPASANGSAAEAGDSAGNANRSTGRLAGDSRVSLTGEQTAANPPAAQPEDRLDRIVREAAVRHQLDPALVKAVITTESNWNPHAISNKGAVGLMQLIPGTAQRFGVRNSLDPAQNVEGGTSYLKSLLDRYNGDLTKSLAAYNAGERAVDLSNGVPAYPETQNYVRKVTNAYFQPGSGRNLTLWNAPRTPVRREQSSSGGVVFTNE